MWDMMLLCLNTPAICSQQSNWNNKDQCDTWSATPLHLLITNTCQFSLLQWYDTSSKELSLLANTLFDELILKWINEKA